MSYMRLMYLVSLDYHADCRICSVAIGRDIGYTGYGGGDLHILIRMAHSR